MKQIHIDAEAGEIVYLLTPEGVSTGTVEKVILTNKGIEYTVMSNSHVYWVGIVAYTKEELLAKITEQFSKDATC